MESLVFQELITILLMKQLVSQVLITIPLVE